MKLLLWTTSVLALSASHTLASDLLIYDQPATYNTASVDWDGFYLGITGGPAVDAPDSWLGINGVAGVNVVLNDDFLVGVELSGGPYWGSSTNWEAYLNGRVGVTFDEFMIYAYGGVGLDGGEGYYDLGLGGELMVADQMSLRLSAISTAPIGSPLASLGLHGGALWHF